MDTHARLYTNTAENRPLKRTSCHCKTIWFVKAIERKYREKQFFRLHFQHLQNVSAWQKNLNFHSKFKMCSHIHALDVANYIQYTMHAWSVINTRWQMLPCKSRCYRLFF